MKMRVLLIPLLLIPCLFFIPDGVSQDPPKTKSTVPMPTVPKDFDVTIFAQPPQVNYPTCLTTDPITGAVFVGIDKQGSLGKKKGDGRVERCIDTDGDGKADKFNTFAKMDHPRGLIYDHGKLWVLHPPELTLYTDNDLDGTADSAETLITGITTNQLNQRGADHTTNGIRMGIDGWIYIAVGDFGFVNAKGKDGRTLTLKGGGIVRVRPDGTEMELYCRGLRNIMDVCIDPFMNTFTRDNTNDGGGWDIRLSHIVQSAHYGYPSLFKNFGDEIMPPLADYGGGSGCGGMFLSEPAFPEKYQHALLTCDWGRSTVFFHPLTKNGATFKAGQEDFVKIPRPTDIDADGSGRLFISSWHNGKFKFSGENVGYVAQLKQKGTKPTAFPDLGKATNADLLKHLLSDSHVVRFHSQREILRRGAKEDIVKGLQKIMVGETSLHSCVSAIYTYKQLLGAKANADLVELSVIPVTRAYVLRALTDRKSQMEGVPLDLFVKSLSDENPRVQLAALIGIGRLGKAEAANAVLKLAKLPEEKATSTVQTAAYRSGLIKDNKRSVKINAKVDGAKKLFLVVANAGDGNGLDHAAWVNPTLTGPKGKLSLTTLKWKSAISGWGKANVNRDCDNNPLKFKGKIVEGIGTHAHSVIAYDLPEGYEKFQAQGVLDDGSKGKGSVRFYVFTDTLPATYAKSNATVVKDVSKYVLPHVAIRTLIELNAVDACLEAVNGPSNSGAHQALRNLHEPKAVQGLIAKLESTRNEKQRHEILRSLIRLYYTEGDYKGTWWGTRPDTSGPYYHRTEWTETPRLAKVLRQQILSSPSSTVHFMVEELGRHKVMLKDLPPDLVAKSRARDLAPTIEVKVPKFDRTNPNQLGNIEVEKVLAAVLKDKGEVELGSKLFKVQTCHACHTTEAGQRTLGPSLVDVGKRYTRKQIAESILKPSAQVAQGFETILFQMSSGRSHLGFVVREAADEVEIRTAEGKSLLLPLEKIERRIRSKQSIMPDGLVHNLKVEELASLIAYLESLRKE